MANKEFKYRINGKEYAVEVGELEGSTRQVTVNGRSYTVEVEETAAAPLAPAGVPAASAPRTTAAPAAGSAATASVTAPLPGTINDVRVKAGDKVKAGQVIVILEAMKMENEIQAPSDGTVSAVSVSKGDAVAEGAVMVVIEGVAQAAASAPAPVAAPKPVPSPAPTPAPAPKPATAPVAGGNDVTAPLPGTINDVRVKVGDSVTEGQVVVILEAMKMENEIQAPAAGKVLAVNVRKGDAVAEGSVMITIG